MRALTWLGNENVEVTGVPDPQIQEPNDVIIGVTSTAICGSDLHLYGVLGPHLKHGDVLGHEATGTVEWGRPGDLEPEDRRSRCHHVRHLARALLDVQPPAVRQCETTQLRSRQRGCAVRLHLALWLGAGRPSAVPASAPSTRRPHGYEIFRAKAPAASWCPAVLSASRNRRLSRGRTGEPMCKGQGRLV